MDLTLGSIVGKIAEGLPIAVGLFLLLLAGSRAIWRWDRELTALDQTWQKRYDDINAAWLARFTDSQQSCDEWRDIAKRLMAATEKIVPAVANKISGSS
jgi:hypothetical protein